MLFVNCTLLNLHYVYFIYTKFFVFFNNVIVVNVICIIIMMAEYKLKYYLDRLFKYLHIYLLYIFIIV